MSIFLCNLWPYLVGGLIGWLFSGWLARRLKFGNPEDVERIDRLEKENQVIGGLYSSIQEFKNTGASHLQKINNLQSDITIFKSKQADDHKYITNLESEIEAERQSVANFESKGADDHHYIIKLEEDLKQENKVIKQLQSDNNKYKADTVRHFKNISKLEQKNKDHESKVEENNQYITGLHSELKKEKGAMDRLNTDLQESNTKTANQLKTITTLESDNNKFIADLEKEQQAISTLRLDLKNAEGQGSDDRQHLAKLKSELEKEKQAASSLNLNLADFKSKGSIDQNHITQLEADLKKQNQQLASLQSDNDQYASDLEKESKTVSALRLNLKDNENKGSDDRQQLANLKSEQIKERQSMTALRLNLANIKTKENNDQGRMIKLESDLKKETQEIAILRSDLQKSNTENNNYIEQVFNLEKERVIVANLHSDLQQSKDTVANNINYIAELEKEKNLLEKLRLDINGYKNTQSDNQKSIADLKSKLLTEQKKGESHEGEIKTLRSNLLSTENKSASYVTQISSLGSEIKRKRELDVKAMGNLKATLEKEQDAILSLDSKLKRKEEIESNHLKKIAELKDSSKIIDQLQIDIRQYENKDARSLKQIAELERSKAEINIVNFDKQKCIIILEEEGAKAQSALQKQSAELEVIKLEFDRETTENIKYLNHITQLKFELDQYKSGDEIDLKAAQKAGISLKSKDDFTAIEGIGSKVNQLIHQADITTFQSLSNTSTHDVQKILNKAGAKDAMTNSSTWSDQAYLAAHNRWSALKVLQDALVSGVYSDFSKVKGKQGGKEGQLKTVNVRAAKLAGFTVRGSATGKKHDFTVVLGIGSKINELIHNAGIYTYSTLAETKVSTIQTILNDAGSRFRLAQPDTWPQQSNMAANNQWNELKEWQYKLDGGKV